MRHRMAERPHLRFCSMGPLSTFELMGFERTRRIGKHKWVVTRTIRDGCGPSTDSHWAVHKIER